MLFFSAELHLKRIWEAGVTILLRPLLSLVLSLKLQLATRCASLAYFRWFSSSSHPPRDVHHPILAQQSSPFSVIHWIFLGRFRSVPTFLSLSLSLALLGERGDPLGGWSEGGESPMEKKAADGGEKEIRWNTIFVQNFTFFLHPIPSISHDYRSCMICHNLIKKNYRPTTGKKILDRESLIVQLNFPIHYFQC